MKVLLVGSGAREHALAWKLSQSPLLEGELIIAPGNAGLAQLGRLAPIKADDIDGLTRLAQDEKVDLVVVGPELALAAGLADRLEEAGIKCFGPKAAAARLESSKPFAKEFMARHNIPTAAWKTFKDSAAALDYLAGKPDGPIVVKAAGLAQGKGVTVAQNRAEAEAAVRQAMDEGCFGQAGRELIIEDFIAGEELTILAFCDGRNLEPMPPTQDHKRVGEGDRGPNTGGMGAYSPVAIYGPELDSQVRDKIIEPTLKGLKADGLDFRGCLYFGLIVPEPGSAYQGPQVIEYNARFGDPETEVLMPLLDSDFLAIAALCAEGRLAEAQISWTDEACVCVVLASEGYPGPYPSGLHISEKTPEPDAAEAIVFHAGTAFDSSGALVSAGGRVITVAARGADLKQALARAYGRAETIEFQGRYFRRDIAHRELARRR